MYLCCVCGVVWWLGGEEAELHSERRAVQAGGGVGAVRRPNEGGAPHVQADV